jgi:hypothetical protein
MTKLLLLLFVFCQGHIYDDDAQLAAPAFHEVRRWRRGHAWENSVGSSLVGDMDALASIKSPAGDQIRGWLGMRGGTRPAPDKRASTQAPVAAYVPHTRKARRMHPACRLGVPSHSRAST